ncbi:beta-1,6-N-acetylglucosaminyltransferase [Flavobacterium sp. MMLR14_040]|uniref:beta-1,6-N-acetylglucosaminyltransferase n=1 Tax=Flavobacterium sp. MMLR14_040 TaxID=3093843 RepID=UPI002990052C|nr:beta-1,6-N-acetylglucosaminyltransferase [Flavobacterium sp. MMLR14_040]MDW8852242.1 beta-1,6-N-acetylglucosaminyltransferase [Flavobacterium sp. MMLR14_040]
MQKPKIAYLIQAHGDPENLLRLINALDDNNDFFIHIDKKSDITPFYELLKAKNNVFFLEGQKRIKVYWGGFSQVEATLNLIEECLIQNDINKEDYLKVILISGSDYPIKSTAEFKEYLVDLKEVNFIRGMNVTEANTKKYNYCLRNYLFFDFFLINKTITRFSRKTLNILGSTIFKKPNYVLDNQGKRLDIFHGSSWWALNIDVVQYIAAYSKEHTTLKKYFRYSLASDEKYFHTIFFNSGFSKTNIYKGAEPYIPATSAFANLHIIDTSLSKWFDEKDFDIIKTSEKFFVRKVSTQKSQKLLDIIDIELL